LLTRIVVSGEGVTDIGVAANEQPVAHDEDFQQGPLFILINKMLEQHLPEWNNDTSLITKTFVYRKALGDLTRNDKLPLKLSSKKGTAKGHIEHAKRAYALALIAQRESQEGEQHIAVYFHDTDGTRKELEKEPARQQNRVAAINYGFEVAGCATGVAMVPKPTSEAWLICSCKDNPYQFCNALETDLAGNKRSPKNAPKNKLAKAIRVDSVHRDHLKDIAEQMNVSRVNMDSFNLFRESMKSAIENIFGEVED
jgi:hypothetical protein